MENENEKSDIEASIDSLYGEVKGLSDRVEKLEVVVDSLAVKYEEGNIDAEDLFESAKEVVLSQNRASTALIQRKLRVGYSKAAKLIMLLEERGVIGPAIGAQPREIIREKEQCNCNDPLCAKCLLINCTDDDCQVHTLEKKNEFREMYRNR